MTGMRTSNNRERSKADKEIAARPPVIKWERDKHGVMRAVEIDDPHAETKQRTKGDA